MKAFEEKHNALPHGFLYGKWKGIRVA
jgi:hypothetical protein